MTDQILNTILENSYTLHELRKRVRILKSYISNRLFGSETADIDMEIRAEVNWLHQLGDPFYLQFNQSNFSPTFEEIEKKIEHLNHLIIYFAFEPSQIELHHVGEWLRKNYGPQFLFDAKFDPSLIAGCAFVWKGLYRDYSLKTKLTENKQGIIEVIRSSINTTK